MKWQDIVIGIGSFVFFIALIPMIRGKEKPPIFSSASTSFFLWAFVVCYVSFGLWLSTVSGVLSAGAWTILLIQKLRQRRNNGKMVR